MANDTKPHNKPTVAPIKVPYKRWSDFSTTEAASKLGNQQTKSTVMRTHMAWGYLLVVVVVAVVVVLCCCGHRVKRDEMVMHTAMRMPK